MKDGRAAGRIDRVHAADRIIHAVVVEVAVAATVFGRVQGGESSDCGIVIPPAEAHQSRIGIFQPAGETYGQVQVGEAVVVGDAEAERRDFLMRGRLWDCRCSGRNYEAGITRILHCKA